MIEHAGLRVGVVGLAEEAWVDTLACVPPESVRYVPFEAAAAAAAAELRAAGADFVIALTHMRQPNDERLAAAATGVDIVLGCVVVRVCVCGGGGSCGAESN
jgi:5'-nucleotidase